MGSYLSIITLNVNGLNTPTKRQRLAEWNKKQDPIYAVYKRPTSKQGTHSASLCLLVGAFNPFTFKVIIDKYDPIAIYFIVWGSSLYTLFVFPV